MTERTGIRPTDWATSLIRSAMLMAGLAVILLVAYDAVVPRSSGLSHWRAPLLIASVGGLAVLLAWPSQSAEARSRTIDGIAMMFGAVSLVLGIGAVMLIGYGLGLHISEKRISSQALIYQLTRPSDLRFILNYSAAVALPGVIGLWLALRRGREAVTVSVAGAARRYSIVGLGLAGLIGAGVSFALVYRWITWGI